MAKSHPRYSPEFKQRAVELYSKAGTSCAQVAKELGIDPGTLAHWVVQAKEPESTSSEQNPFEMAEELKRLKRENKRLKEENEILLKASAFFASKHM